MLFPATKSLSFALVAVLALAGCSGAAQTEDEAQRSESALTARAPSQPGKGPPTPIPGEQHIQPPAPVEPGPSVPPEPLPPMPPSPLPPTPAPPCFQIAQCMSGQTFDATPGVCMCVWP